ncbi:MAG: UvrD/REP helicase, helicase / ATP-dependent helicase PcrA [Candidatus Nomurabacteria bacterium]|nr:UvrD/REP helicase, helicase / ATP-dependent helicase PcrA [Candidatus Nomurabacteria bacterium]
MEPSRDTFLTAYNNLNAEQKRAVDTIGEGPVMVIAGPGTGKTQVLSLRIANIRQKTDTSPDSILCLTFTNAGVKAMRERLMKYIGAEASRVRISTFHSFALDCIDEFHDELGLDAAPVLLDTTSTVVLFDELLHMREWQYLRPRANSTMYVRDIQSLISVLKRERITVENFRNALSADIERLQQDPDSISSRGETKGQLKKEIEKKIEGLQRSMEVADFYEAYESLKKERNVIDYNDALTLLVQLVETSDNARDTIRERYHYILVDEHQDSSGIQNEFLSTVWQDVEKPEIFVVGDDRQLIYGFGGASLAYFENFKHTFGKAKLITLTENYRSTQTILDTAEALLQSTLAEGKLISNTEVKHPVRLVESDYPRDEIIAAGLWFKERNADGISLDHCAILVPKNRHVKAAMQVLRDMGLPVAAASALQLFELPDTQAFLTILHVMAEPFNTRVLSRSLLDPLAGIPPLVAHQFLMDHGAKKLNIDALMKEKEPALKEWGTKLTEWLTLSQNTDAYGLIQHIGSECLLGNASNDETVRRRVEIIRTLLHLALMQSQRGESVDIKTFIDFVDRLQEYHEDISLAVFGADTGIKVLTLHGSKGLEFDAVWIAHMDERSFMGSKRQAFTLPELIEEKAGEQDELAKKRELYVAITRAKYFCTISYSHHSYAGVSQQLASIVAELPEPLFVRQSVAESEAMILEIDKTLFVTSQKNTELHDVTTLVAQEYAKRKISVTMLNNFFECPWKWYFRNLLQLPEPMSDSLQVGNLVHKTIDAILKGIVTTDKEVLRSVIHGNALIEARYIEQHAKELTAQTLPIIMNWIEQYLPNVIQPFSTEKSLPYHDAAFPHLSMYGKIDLVEEIISGEVRVTDWKTGSVKTGTEIEKRDEAGRMSGLLRQLAMYSYLVEGVSNNDRTVTESRLVFLEAKKGDKNAAQTRHITPEELALLRKDIADYDNMVKNGTWIHCPCTTKRYGENDECEYCAMAKRYGIYLET